VLVERGDLSYAQRVADVWPEFSAHGKGSVTLGDVLVHTAGVLGLWPQIAPENLCDWDRVCAFIAEERPWWPPRTQTGYHALTFGFVLGELVRRATGRTLAAALRKEIVAPLAVADELHFGDPHHLLARVARQGPEGAAPSPTRARIAARPRAPVRRAADRRLRQPPRRSRSRRSFARDDVRARRGADVRRAPRPRRRC
jgi:CubicO group peptidase (beta-lactamase class C family)